MSLKRSLKQLLLVLHLLVTRLIDASSMHVGHFVDTHVKILLFERVTDNWYVKSNNDMFYIIFSVCLLLACSILDRHIYLFYLFIFFLFIRRNHQLSVSEKKAKRPNQIDLSVSQLQKPMRILSVDREILNTNKNYLKTRQNSRESKFLIEVLPKRSSAWTRCRIPKLWERTWRL